MKTNPFAFIASQLENHLPEALHPLHSEVKKAAQRAVEAPLAKFDLVPRAEFAAQSEELQALRSRIAALEAHLAALSKTPS